MKKFISTITAVLLSLCLCIGLAACGGGTHEGDHNTDNPYESTGEYHTVTFDSRGGSEVEAQTVLDGDYARQPSRPEKTGSYFLHWSEEIEGERFVFTSRIITKDMTLYAVWGEAYTVRFDTQGGSDIPAQYVSPNTSARNPDSPIKEGFNFLGWYTEAEGGIEWKWNDPVTGNITVYAHWESDGETGATESLEFEYDTALGGYVVTGVGQESALRIPAEYNGTRGTQAVVGIGDRAFYNKRITSVEFPASLVSIGGQAFTRTDLTSVTIPASVTTLGNYAFSECKSLTSVTFEAGSQLGSIGQRAFADDPKLLELTIPASVTSIGSRLIYNSGVATIRFLGTRSAWDAIDKAENWNYGNTDVKVICSDDSSASGPTEPTGPTGPTEPETFTVTFDSRDGSSVAAQEIEENGLVEEPEDPTKSNALFSYWETASGDLWRFNRDRVTGDMTLYAVWNDAYIVTFDTQGGSAVPSQTVVAGTSARKPDMPTREGYNFLGWYTSAAGTTAWEWNAPVAANITVYAHWEDANTQTPTASLTFSYNSTLGGLVVTGAGQETAIRIPATASDRTHASANVVGIDARAFSYSDIVSVSLPAAITSIGEYAFNRCDNLVSVEIPAAVTEIGNYAFANCAALSSVTFGTGDLALKTIGSRAFAYDPELTELTIPASVTSIGSSLIRSSGITTIHFLGTRSAWEEVAKEGWDTGKTDVTVICADEAPAAILSDRKELA